MGVRRKSKKFGSAGLRPGYALDDCAKNQIQRLCILGYHVAIGGGGTPRKGLSPTWVYLPNLLPDGQTAPALLTYLLLT